MIKIKNRNEIFNIVKQNSICAEIGVWKGRNAEEIINRNQPKKLYLIDPWLFDQEELKKIYFIANTKEAKNQSDMDNIYLNVIKKFNNKNVEIIREKSHKASLLFQDEYFDWIYIDGAHDYENVFRDLNCWSKKVKEEGFLVLDDWDWGPGKYGYPIRKAIDVFIKENLYEHYAVGDNQCLLKRIKNENC